MDVEIFKSLSRSYDHHRNIPINCDDSEPHSIIRIKDMFYAAKNSFPDSLNTMIQNSTDKSIINSVENGVTMLMLACDLGHFEITRVLLENGANTEIRDCKGFTALMYAVYSQNYMITQLCLQYGAVLKIKSFQGFTPFSVAIRNNNAKLVELLCSYESDDIDSFDFSNEPPYCYVMELNNQTVLNKISHYVHKPDSMKRSLIVSNPIIDEIKKHKKSLSESALHSKDTDHSIENYYSHEYKRKPNHRESYGRVSMRELLRKGYSGNL